MLTESDLSQFDELTRKHHNLHAELLQTNQNTPIEDLSKIVNSLMVFILQSGPKRYRVGDEVIDLRAMRAFLRWQSTVLKKCLREGKMLYVTRGFSGEIVAGRTKSLERDYRFHVLRLLKLSENFGDMIAGFTSELIEDE